MKKTAPGRHFRKSAVFVRLGNINTPSEQECHFRMAHFVRFAAGKYDTERVKRLLAQSMRQFASAHTPNLSTGLTEFYRVIKPQGEARNGWVWRCDG